MKSRVAQLTARGIAFIGAALVGHELSTSDMATVNDAAELLASGLVLLAPLALDLLIHRMRGASKP